MKLVINNCYGGFSLSAAALARLAEKRGKKAYFFEHNFKTKKYAPLTQDEADKSFCPFAFDIPNPNDFEADEQFYEKHKLDSCPDDRADTFLVEVVEELGEKANGGCAELKVLEIPDGVEWVIDEYDGIEHIAEKHRTWS